MYEYLSGCAILFIIWLWAFIIRRDLRKPMIWSGVFYLIINTLLFIIFKFFFLIGTLRNSSTIVPGYWSPDTLFNLGRTTGGYALEDAIFMMLVGGIATFLYDYIHRKKIKIKKNRKHHVRAPIIGFFIAIVFALITQANIIYALMVFGIVGAASIWIERKDLIKNSLFGGFAFLIIYFLAFLLFNWIFPGFISQAYNLKNLSGILVLTVPLEELLYAISFGLIWSPIYEYAHGEKDIDE